MEIWRSPDEASVREAVAWAAAEKSALRILGAGSKEALGRPVAARRVLDLSALAGVTLYEPADLVLRALAGTSLRAIEALIGERGQALAFEPRDLGPLLGKAQGHATLGGIVATNLAGPRRFKAGAVRDHILGFSAVNGRAEIFKSGGRVMKNVTGYDLPKLMTGAFGTLAVLTQITLRTVPAPEDERTLVIVGLDDRSAMMLLRDALALPHDISGAAHLPSSVARRSAVASISALKESVTLMRLDGLSSALEARLATLLARFRRPGFFVGPLAERGGAMVLDKDGSRAIWAEIRDVSYFVNWPGPVWRVSTAPMNGAHIAAAVGAQAWFYDWGGGLVWLLVDDTPQADEALVRRAALAMGGHATLIRATEVQRASIDIFEPQPPALAAISQRVKESFDPLKILNPGLMYRGV